MCNRGCTSMEGDIDLRRGSDVSVGAVGIPVAAGAVDATDHRVEKVEAARRCPGPRRARGLAGRCPYDASSWSGSRTRSCMPVQRHRSGLVGPGPQFRSVPSRSGWPRRLLRSIERRSKPRAQRPTWTSWSDDERWGAFDASCIGSDGATTSLRSNESRLAPRYEPSVSWRRRHGEVGDTSGVPCRPDRVCVVDPAVHRQRCGVRFRRRSR